MKRTLKKFVSVLLAAVMIATVFQSLFITSFAEVVIPEMNSVDSSVTETDYWELDNPSSSEFRDNVGITLSHKAVYLDMSENMSISGFTYTYFSRYGENGALGTKFQQFVYGPLCVGQTLYDDPAWIHAENNDEKASHIKQWIGNGSISEYKTPPVNYNEYFTNFGVLDPNVLKDREAKSTRSSCTIDYKFDGTPTKTTGDGATVYLHVAAELGGAYSGIKYYISNYTLPRAGFDGIPHFTLYVYDKAPLKTALENAIANLGKNPVNAAGLQALIDEGKTVYAERAVTDTQVKDITDRLNNFVLQFTVDTAVAPESTGSVTVELVSGNKISENVYTDGSVLKLTAAPGADYDFEVWSGAGAGTETPAEFTVTGNSVYTANFKFVYADYTKLNETIASVPQDLSIYTDASVGAVNTALAAANDAVSANYGKSKQQDVDNIAKALDDAIKALEREYKLSKYKSQVKFSGVKPIPEDLFVLRVTSVIKNIDLVEMTSGGNSIVKLGFIAADSDVLGVEAAKTAVENGTELPTGWKEASTDYISQEDADSNGYFGCQIKNISHEAQTKDIQCMAYAAYTDGETTKYVWYADVISAAVATNYDMAVKAWAEQP